MPLAYADNADIVGRNYREVAFAFSKFAEKARINHLVVNESKTNLLLSTAKDNRGIR